MADCVIAVRGFHERDSLKHYLRKFPKGMPEDCIAIALNSIIKGIGIIELLHEGGRPVVNTARIGVIWARHSHLRHSIRLAYHERHMQMGGDNPERPQVGIWGAGIVALELAYGSLPENITPQQMVTMANNLVRILRQKLDNRQKKIKKLPNTLQMLLDDQYVNRREKKLIAKKNEKGIRRAINVLQNSVRSLPNVETYQKRSFSRGFLDVVMRCLDKENPTPINQILDLPILKNVFANDMYYFERIVR